MVDEPPNDFGNKPREMKMKIKPDIALASCLTGVALLATGQSMAAGFYLTQVGTPMSIGTVGVTNTTNTWGVTGCQTISGASDQ